MKKHLILLISLFVVISLTAQDVNYATSILNELTSEKYHGRGYVKNGDSKAAKFISKQFKNDGLDNFNDSYFQKYSFPINTFPGNISVSIDNEELIPGEDYVISLSASSTDKQFEIHNIVNFESSFDSLLLFMHNAGDDGMYFINEKNTRKTYGTTIPDIEAIAILTDKTPYWHVSNGGTVENTTWLKIKKEST